MRKLTLCLVAGAALAVAGVAYAQPGPAAGGEMTRAEVEQRTAQAFGRMDANGDGKLDKADRDARRKVQFDSIDADHDGSVSFAEFSAMRPMGDGDRGERIGRREGRGMAQGAPHLRGMGRMADGDRDGTVTQAEFQAAALGRFDRLDADKDGTVTREEHRAARDAMRQHRRGEAG